MDTFIRHRRPAKEVLQIKRIKVDWDFLTLAFEDASYETEYYLDTETGKVIMISDLAMTLEESEEIRDKMDEDSENRYIYVEKQTPRDGYQDMEDFIETIEDENLKEKLYIAIDGRGAFGRFKRVLEHYPEEQKRWFSFKDTRLEQRIAAWLESEGYEADKQSANS